MVMDRARVFLTAGLVVAAISLLFQIIGVATNGWTSFFLLSVHIKRGLWQQCVNDVCASFSGDRGTNSDSLYAARAMEIMSILVATAGCVAIATKAYISRFSSDVILAWFCPAAMLAAGVLGLIGVPIFCGTSVACADHGDYSLALTIVGSMLYILFVMPITFLARYFRMPS